MRWESGSAMRARPERAQVRLRGVEGERAVAAALELGGDVPAGLAEPDGDDLERAISMLHGEVLLEDGADGHPLSGRERPSVFQKSPARWRKSLEMIVSSPKRVPVQALGGGFLISYSTNSASIFRNTLSRFSSSSGSSSEKYSKNAPVSASSASAAMP